MKIGLIDADGHHFPNLALMRISAYHKSVGDEVVWYEPMFTGHCDKVYMSKVFSFSPEYEYFIDADEVVKGGTGYRIKLIDGKEVFDDAYDELPQEIEMMSPDYSIYPQYDFAVSMTSRGCPRGCPFCHVAAKEGRKSVKVANVTDFWKGQKHIEVLDPNITACKDKHELFGQYAEISKRGVSVNFSQGLDIRLITEQDMEDINAIKLSGIHFAWDNPKDDLAEKFKFFADNFKNPKWLYRNAGAFVLTNFNSSIEEDLHRIYTIRDLGFSPYVMIYDKEHCDKQHKALQRWCNNRFVFRSCNRFEDYKWKA